MKLPIIGIHPVVVLGVLLPDFCGFNRMEARLMLTPEHVHIAQLRNAVVVAGEVLIPSHTATLIDDGNDHIRLHNAVDDLIHHLRQDDFMNAREALRIGKIGDC